MKINRKTVRRLMIEKQGFGPQPSVVRKNDIYDRADRLGCIQIDSINVVERAHYLTLWSRLGCYDKVALHDLIYRDKLLFEHWAHQASIIPMREYRYFIYPQHTSKAELEERFQRWGGEGDPGILDHVLERIRLEGPLAARDFEYKRRSPSRGWWDWKPAKVALEVLFAKALLLVSHRENFQRYYELAERVLPDWVDTSEPTEEERVHFFTIRTLGCLGLARASDIRLYYRSERLRKNNRQLRAFLDELVEEGETERFMVEDEGQPYYCLAEDARRVEEIEAGDFDFEGVRLLTNFDNLLWLRDRVRALFGFAAKLEAFVPKEKRRYGYFNMPILYGDRLVGRIVPKMDRKSGTLIVNSIWHEPWFTPDEPFYDGFSRALDNFARFNGAKSVEKLEEEPRIG